MMSCSFQVISSVFSPGQAGHDIMVRLFIMLQPLALGAAPLPLFNYLFAGAAAQRLWWAGAACAPHSYK